MSLFAESTSASQPCLGMHMKIGLRPSARGACIASRILTIRDTSRPMTMSTNSFGVDTPAANTVLQRQGISTENRKVSNITNTTHLHRDSTSELRCLSQLKAKFALFDWESHGTASPVPRMEGGAAACQDPLPARRFCRVYSVSTSNFECGL